ncbi:hypothetical protein HYV79_02865 [Candidatus Woesearchaeota archaeon]|nr:hypothetical protein [Candidatus Woesearchaeota archaeon]
MVKLLKNHALKFFLVFAILLVFLSSAFAHKLIPEEPQSPHESYTLTGKVVAEQVLSCGESRGVERYGVIQVPLSKGLAENLGKRFKSFIFEKYSKEFYVPEKIKAACVEAKKMCVSDMLKVTSQFSTILLSKCLSSKCWCY